MTKSIALVLTLLLSIWLLISNVLHETWVYSNCTYNSSLITTESICTRANCTYYIEAFISYQTRCGIRSYNITHICESNRSCAQKWIEYINNNKFQSVCWCDKQTNNITFIDPIYRL